MRRALPTPADLSEHPQLAVLSILEETVDQSIQTLVAAYPENWKDECQPVRSWRAAAACAKALLFQLYALDGTLRHYRQTLDRLEERSQDEDWPTECDLQEGVA